MGERDAADPDARAACSWIEAPAALTVAARGERWLEVAVDGPLTALGSEQSGIRLLLGDPGRPVSPWLTTRVLRVTGLVPNERVRLQAQEEGLDAIFLEAGAEWRGAGCSMCLGMNPDQLAPGERSASTSNRNFEGRQGKGGRTHLVSPEVASATAVLGHLASPADLEPVREPAGV